ATALAAVAGVLAVAAGVVYRNWRLSLPVAAVATIFTVLIAQFNPRQGDLVLQLVGLALLGGAGAVGGVTVRKFVGTIERQSRDLQLKHRAFMAATSGVEGALQLHARGPAPARSNGGAHADRRSHRWLHLAGQRQGGIQRRRPAPGDHVDPPRRRPAGQRARGRPVAEGIGALLADERA